MDASCQNRENSSKRTDPSERFPRKRSCLQQALVGENGSLRNNVNQAPVFVRKLDGTAANVAPAKMLLLGEVFAMHTKATTRIFIQSLPEVTQREVILRGWVYRLRMLSKTTFVILKDCSGEAQCVAATEVIEELHLKTEDVKFVVEFESTNAQNTDAKLRFSRLAFSIAPDRIFPSTLRQILNRSGLRSSRSTVPLHCEMNT